MIIFNNDPLKRDAIKYSGIANVPDSFWNALGPEKTIEIMHRLASGEQIYISNGNWVIGYGNKK